MKLQKERTLASEIIDIVEDAIRKAHPSVNKIGKGCQGNTLLYGEKYYDLEDTLTKILRNSIHGFSVSKKIQKYFNPSKRR